MSCDKYQNERQAQPPMTDEEFDAWWPFSDDDLDEYEREIEESLPEYKALPDSDFEETRQRAEETARRTLAKKRPGRMTEEQLDQLPPGLLAYWRGEAPTPYSDPAGRDEFLKTTTSSADHDSDGAA